MRSGFRCSILSLTAFLIAAPAGHTWEAGNPPAREYRLRFYNTHTNERIDVVYRRGENYLPEAEKYVISIPTCSTCSTISPRP
jgi:hypothetical protein